MTLENSSLELVNSLKALRESTADLLHIITEDRPEEHSLAHRFEHGTSEVLGRLDATLNAALRLEQTARRYDYGQAFDALGTCNAEFNLAAEKFNDELKSYDWLQDLDALGYERSEQWSGWTTSIKATLAQCNFPVVYVALLSCWQSLVISSGTISTKHVKNIDQEISLQESNSEKGELKWILKT